MGTLSEREERFYLSKTHMFKNLEIMNLHAKRMVLKTDDLPQKPDFSMKVFFFGVRLDHGASGPYTTNNNKVKTYSTAPF